MKPLLVIADDLTGAAELAGIGLRFGLPTRLIVDRDPPPPLEAHLTVINADTRPLPEADAVRVVSDLVSRFAGSADLFKKIDSVLRGHIIAEIHAALDRAPEYDRVLLLPQNPSRQRVVRADGIYLVDGVPLARTAFAADPDHPARTSNVMDRVARARWPARLSAVPGDGLSPGVIHLAAAETVDRVREWAAQITPGTLPVGAADLFTALLQSRGNRPVAIDPADALRGRRLYLCGSTATSARRLLRSFATSNSIDVVDTADRARRSLALRGVAVVMSPEPGGVEQDPRDIEQSLGAIARTLLDEKLCDWVFAEGGATATSVCRAMKWNSLDVETELATGVVVLRPTPVVRLVIKPGSYAWPEVVLTPDRS